MASGRARLRMRPADDGAGSIGVTYPLAVARDAQASWGALPAAFAEALERALQDVPATGGTDARIELLVTVYASSGEQRHKPVLSLSGLYIPLARISSQRR